MRTCRPSSSLLATFALAALVASARPAAAADPTPGPAPAATSSPAQQADELFLKGKALLKEGKKQDALAAYRAAFNLRKSYDVAGNLCSLELDLGLHRDAAEHIAYALSHYAASGTTQDQLAKAKQRFETARKEVCVVHVTVSAAGAEVLVDGASIGRAPIAEDVFVQSGARKIEARYPGYVTATKSVDAKKGGTEDVTLEMVAEAAPVPTATASATATVVALPPRSLFPSVIAFGVGGAGLVAGAITGALSVVKLGELKTACGGDFSCPPPRRGEADAGKTLGDISTAGFVIAGVGAALGVTLLLVPLGKTAPAKASVTVGPTFVGVKGVF